MRLSHVALHTKTHIQQTTNNNVAPWIKNRTLEGQRRNNYTKLKHYVPRTVCNFLERNLDFTSPRAWVGSSWPRCTPYRRHVGFLTLLIANPDAMHHRMHNRFIFSNYVLHFIFWIMSSLRSILHSRLHFLVGLGWRAALVVLGRNDLGRFCKRLLRIVAEAACRSCAAPTN